MDANKRRPRQRSYASSPISSITQKMLSKKVNFATSTAFSMINPLFDPMRVSDIDVQLNSNAEKTYDRFCRIVGELAGELRDSLKNAVDLSEYNGEKNESFESVEDKILSNTVTLVLKKKKTSVITYELYGAYGKMYNESDVYTTDDMVYTSKLFKKRLNFKPSMKLGECYKIVSEVKNSDNEYAGFLSMTAKDVFEAKSAFIDYNVVGNGGSCYRVIADNYLLICFKMVVNVPYWFSDEMEDRYTALDYDEYDNDDIVYSRFPDGTTLKKRLNPDGSTVELEALRRYYRKLFKERFYKNSRNSMFEARKADFENLAEEYSLFESIFKNTSLIINSLMEGNIDLSSFDKSLKEVSESTAQLNVLVEVAKEFYGNIDSFTIDKDYYLNKYEQATVKTAQKAYIKYKIPKMSLDLHLFSDTPLITFSSEGNFDEPLTDKDVKFIATNAGEQSSDLVGRLTVDVGREGIPRATAKYENGCAVFTVLSNTYDRNEYDTDRAKMIRVPGKVWAVSKLIISIDGFKVTSESGSNR